MLKKILLIIIYLLVCNCTDSDDKNITQPSPSITGCIDPNAYNFIINATIDDGSCTYINSGDHPLYLILMVVGELDIILISKLEVFK